MEKLLLKYQTLTPEVQKEVTDFVDFVATTKKNVFNLKNWKRKILNVSVWSSNDILLLKKNSKGLKSWKPQKW